MSSSALAYDFIRTERRLRVSRQKATRTAVLPWTDIAVANTSWKRPDPKRSVPVYVWSLAGAAIAAHFAIGWYATHSVSDVAIKPRKHEVAVEFVQPPKPEIEPPKPVPPKPQLKKPAQVLPPIQTAVPDLSDPVDSVSAEPVAVAPVVSAPVEPAPEPITAPVGHAGYLNNPPPDYPPIAVRQGWQGTVLLRVHVLSSGKVEVVEIQQSSGRKLLDEQAIRTVKTWLFTPSRRGETPIDGWATVPIEFKLDS